MSIKFHDDIDLKLNEAKNLTVEKLAAHPDPSDARFYYNTADKKFYGYDDNEWIDLSNRGWRPAVDTYNDLALLNDLEDGLVVYVNDEDTFYSWDTTTSGWILPKISKDQVSDLDLDLLDNIRIIMKEPTGFPNRTDSSLTAVVGSNREFTITGTNFSVYINGKEYIKNTESVTIPDANGANFIYYNDQGVLTQSTTAWDLSSTVPVAIVHYSTSLSEGLVSDERHGLTMDWATHEYLHRTVGTKYECGLAATYNDSTFTIAEGCIWDEDIRLEISEQTNTRVLYRDGTDLKWTSKGTSFYYESGGDIYYDNDGVITPLPDDYYAAYWVFATNNLDCPIIHVMGQKADSSIANARANNRQSYLDLPDFPFGEYKVLYRVIIKNSSVDKEIEIQDLRDVVSTAIMSIESEGAQTVYADFFDENFSEGVNIEYNDADSIIITAGNIEVAGIGLRKEQNLTISLTDSSIFDSGSSRKADTWYFVYAIEDSSIQGEYEIIVSESHPTKDKYGNTIDPASRVTKYHPTLLARYRGSFKTDGSSNILKFIKVGSLTSYVGSYNYILQNGDAATKTGVNCREFVPVTSNLAYTYYQITTKNRNCYLGDNDGEFFTAMLGSGFISIPVTNDSVYYRIDDPGNVNLGIHGYYEDI